MKTPHQYYLLKKKTFYFVEMFRKLSGSKKHRMKHPSTLLYWKADTHTHKLYKSLCMECQRQRRRPTTKGTVVRSILSADYGARAQVDLVDMQSMPHGFFVMVYQDHLTKFCIPRPIPCKRATVIAFRLSDRFPMLGAPAILQSDNGSEFTALQR